MCDLKDVRGLLGGKSVFASTLRSEMDFIPAVHRGFPYTTIESLQSRTGLTEDAILNGLRIPKRTIARRKKEQSVLKPTESELVLRLARAFVAAQRVLGDATRAREWLQSPLLALGGKTPLEMLDTGIGFQEVIDTLGRIEHGVYS